MVIKEDRVRGQLEINYRYVKSATLYKDAVDLTIFLETVGRVECYINSHFSTP